MSKSGRTYTDNKYPATKLELRRHFLRRYHADGAEVLDCCCGDGVLWALLRREFDVNYCGVDVLPKRGRLRIDSVRLLKAGISADVVDVDTYGNPFNHAMALLPSIKKPTTIFLTYGIIRVGGGTGLARSVYPLLGWAFSALTVPDSLATRFSDLQLPAYFRGLEQRGIEVVEAQEAFPQSRARYFGLHVRPRLKTNKEE